MNTNQTLLDKCINSLFFLVLALLVIPSCTSNMLEVPYTSRQQIAHRGYWSAGAEQNSVEAVKLAIEANLYGAEIDVYETIDHVIVVNHDDTFYGKHILSSCYEDLVIDKNSLPRLDDFLPLLTKSSSFKLIIDIKHIYDAKSIIDLLETYGVSDKVEFVSFYKEYCEAIIKHNSKYKVGYLSDDLTLQYLLDNNYDFINYSYQIYLSNPSLIQEAQAVGMEVYSWTVNDSDIMNELYNIGVDLITTDYPIL